MATARRLSLFQVVLLGVVCVATLALLLLLARNTHGPAISPQRDDHGEKMEQLEGRLEEMVQLLHHLHNSSHEAAAAAEKPRRAAPTSAPAAREHHQAGGSGGGALAQLKTKLPFISYSAICLVAHNEGGRRLREFATYHLWIGFGKVYLFDHNSTRAAKREQMELLSPLIEAGKVEYYVFADHHTGRTFEQSAQGFGFETCLRNGIGRHKWMAFLDADEYVVLVKPGQQPPDINAFLKGYEAFPGLGVNWRVFGSSGFLEPPNSTLGSYSRCTPGDAEANRHVKTIANLDRAESLYFHPHALHYKGGARAVNELKVPFEGAFSAPPSHTRIALHHYATRSLAEYRRKLGRARGSTTQPRDRLDPEAALKQQDRRCTETCMAGVELWKQCCSRLT